MNRIILLGNPGTKRAAYFQKAAAEVGVPCRLWEWGQPKGEGVSDAFLKIDPPLWDSCDLEDLAGYVKGYRKDLLDLAQLAETCGLRFLNHPEAILDLLDKERCKRTLRQAGVPVTELLEEQGEDLWRDPIRDTERLMGCMEERRIFQVFIKPRYGSGASGTAAFRFQPGSRRMVLYTCAAIEPQTGRLVNTKRLRQFSGEEGVTALLDRILALDHVVERWYAKAVYQGFSYDLRAVMQDGQMDLLLARLSRGPITNLHLNDYPLPAEALGLPRDTLDAVRGACQKAMMCYPGLQSAGIDILLEKGSLRPRVIEMNGQGDLIYQDIYGENRIYRHQVEMMGGGI